MKKKTIKIKKIDTGDKDKKNCKELSEEKMGHQIEMLGREDECQ